MADFLNKEALEYFRGYNLQPDQITTLKNCIKGEISSQDAANQLSAYPSAAPTPLEMQQRLGGLWALLNNIAVLVPSSQLTIISILKALRRLPRVEEPTGEGEGYMDLDEGDIWVHLSGWPSDLADDLNSWGARVDLDVTQAYAEKYNRATRKAHWTNAAAYVARLTTSGDEALAGYGGFLSYMSFTIVKTLEKTTMGESDEAIKVDGKLEPADLEAVAQLFVHAGPELYRRCKTRHIEKPVRISRGELWHGEEDADYSIEIWDFWKQRWDALAGTDILSDEARKAASEALGAMKKAEA